MRNRRVIVALCGPEGAGKSTAAKEVARRLGGKIHPLAEPLKRMLLAIGVPRESLYGTPEQKLRPLPEFGGRSGRDLMQTLGTEWGRQCVSNNIWIDAWTRDVAGEPLVIVDDLRFQNEAARVKELGGSIIKVVRKYGQEPVDCHPSARFDLITEDRYIVNPPVRSADDLPLAVDELGLSVLRCMQLEGLISCGAVE